MASKAVNRVPKQTISKGESSSASTSTVPGFSKTIVDRMPAFPKFNGRVVIRPSDWEGEHLKVGADAVLSDYIVALYSYGTTSFPERTQPSAIIFANNENDIIKAVRFAFEAGVPLAIRSSGHHFGAFSSTTNDGMVLDVAKLDTIEFNEQDGIWTIGPGCKLGDVSEEMGKQGVFIPHGECSWVCAGGHIQTGGYSPSFSRSFGYFIDHVVSFDIVLAPTKKGQNPKIQTIVKPATKTDKLNDDLWWAVLGGSPGNFGVITKMRVRPIADKDHADARAMAVICLYEKETLELFLQILAEYNDDDDLPADYAFNVIMLQAKEPIVMEKWTHNNLDTLMMVEHPELYGPEFGAHPSMVALVVNWNNLQGDKIKFDEFDGKYCAKNIFEDVKNRTKSHVSLIEKIGVWVAKVARFAGITEIDDSQPIPISKLDALLAFPARCNDNPYVGMDRLNTTEKLTSNGFAEKMAQAIDKAHHCNGVYPVPQWGTMGGRHSAILKYGNETKSIKAFRNASVSCLYYVHYDNVMSGKDSNTPRELSLQSLDDMQKVCDQVLQGDRRRLAFCGQDAILDNVYEFYYDSAQDYQRLLNIKRSVDKTHVFTPNLFAVGGTEVWPTPSE